MIIRKYSHSFHWQNFYHQDCRQKIRRVYAKNAPSQKLLPRFLCPIEFVLRHSLRKVRNSLSVISQTEERNASRLVSHCAVYRHINDDRRTDRQSGRSSTNRWPAESKRYKMSQMTPQRQKREDHIRTERTEIRMGTFLNERQADYVVLRSPDWKGNREMTPRTEGCHISSQPLSKVPPDIPTDANVVKFT